MTIIHKNDKKLHDYLQFELIKTTINSNLHISNNKAREKKQ